MRNYRQSAIETFSICPERYRRQVVNEEPSTESAASLIGTAVHAAQAQVAAYWRDFGEAPPWPAGQMARLRFLESVEVDKLRADPIPWSSEEVIDARAEEAEALATALAAESPALWAKYGKPVLIEQQFSGVRWKEHLYEGTLDCSTDQDIVLDWKTSRRDWPRNKARKRVQPLVYSLGHNALTRRWPKLFVFVVATRTKEVRVHEHPVEVPAVKLDYLDYQVAEIARAEEHNVFPLNPSHELCSPDWCPYWSTCPASVLKEAA